MKKLMKNLVAGAAMVLAVAGNAQAGYVFAGSWNVGDGPNWNSNPLAYSGTGAASFLFGAGTYAISTVDNTIANINNTAHYAVIGIGFRDFAESYFRGTEGITHYQDVYVFDVNVDTVSTYVNDFGQGGRNFAFRLENDVPEPTSVALLGLGLLGLGLGRRKQQ